MLLHINTKDQNLISVALKNDGQILREFSDQNQFGSQVLLSLITRLLESEKLNWTDLMGVEVETGPGSFTGLRVGVAVANAISYGIGVKVNGKKLETDLVYN